MQNGSYLPDVIVMMMLVDDSRDDESNEKKSEKCHGMLVGLPVRFFDSAIGRSVTRLLDMRKVQHTEVCHSSHADTISAYLQCMLNIDTE